MLSFHPSPSSLGDAVRAVRPGVPRLRHLLPLTAAALLLSVPAALAQLAPHTMANPTELTIERPPVTTLKKGPGGEPELQVIPGREALLNLDIRYSDPEATRIFNPSTNRYDRVKLRTYNGKLVAPTVRIHPGETVRMSLSNNLPKEDCPASDPVNTPHCFNHTNMHGHGLWVSPSGNSDNVLLSIDPGVSFQYEYNIPADHPSGLYWYHPHVHGSTALQVSGGMGGALIVEGNRPPTADRPGDIDTILRGKGGAPFRDRVILLQQIQYACRDKDGAIKKKLGPDGKVVAWICDPDDIGTIEGYDQFGPDSWQESGRFTTLNGEVQPGFSDAEAGRIERWRVVHAGVRDTVNLAFLRMKDGAQPYAPSMGPAQQMWIRENCVEDSATPALVQWEFAADGQTHDRFLGMQVSTLQQGYRSDFLTVFPKAGTYCVVDRQTGDERGTVNGQSKSDRLLAFVGVRGKAVVEGDGKAEILKALSTAAGRLPKDVRAAVQADLADGLRTARFAPHKPVSDAEVAGRIQNMTFAISGTDSDLSFTVNGKPFDPSAEPRILTLGTADQWRLTAVNGIEGSSALISHPFHIHINPFEIVKILNPQGVDVTNPAIPRAQRLKDEGGDPQYLDLKGVWKDTIFIKQKYQVIMRTRYERYIGDFVLHCHILDHEDQGMMQLIRIVIPTTTGAPHAHGRSASAAP